jgi:signal transduction histidine kinase
MITRGGVGVRLAGVDEWLRRRPWVADAALAVVLGFLLLPSSVEFVWDAEWSLAARAAVVGVLVLGHATVAGRRSRPVPAYALCCAVMLALVLAPDARVPVVAGAIERVPLILAPSALVFPVTLYAVAAYSGRRWSLAALAVGLLGALLTAVRLWSPVGSLAGSAGSGALGTGGWWLFVLAALVAVVLAAWGLGRLRAVRAAFVDALADRARRDERALIAREMHDVVAHSLAVIVRQAEGGRLVAGKNPELAVRTLSTVADTGREALADMRSLLGALRPDGSPEAIAAGAPQPSVDDIPVLVDRLRGTGARIELVTTGTPTAIERSASLAAYRVVQEALTNVIKHAGHTAGSAVRLHWLDDALEVSVSDDGGDGGTAQVGEGAGHGLVGMRERVGLAGGQLRAGRAPDGGFTVLARLPLRAPGAMS